MIPVLPAYTTWSAGINTKFGKIMSNAKTFGFGTQIRKSPYFDATVKWGAKEFSV